MSSPPHGAGCRGCGNREPSLVQLGVTPGEWDYLVALAGNPNTGKSTVFNALTGLRQHTGNWPGKTVTRAEGSFREGEARFKVVDLPGTYSLQAGRTDELQGQLRSAVGSEELDHERCTVVVRIRPGPSGSSLGLRRERSRG